MLPPDEDRAVVKSLRRTDGEISAAVRSPPLRGRCPAGQRGARRNAYLPIPLSPRNSCGVGVSEGGTVASYLDASSLRRRSFLVHCCQTTGAAIFYPPTARCGSWPTQLFPRLTKPG